MKLHSIFTSINGEICLPHQGSLTTFIRLYGCSLKCSWCFGVVPGRRIPKLVYSQGKSKRIPEVKTGDTLLTFNERKELVETKVIRTIQREVDFWLRITINKKIYFVTPEHPFFTTTGLKRADELQIGDMIYHSTAKDKLSFRMVVNNPMKDERIKKIVHSKKENLCVLCESCHYSEHRIGYNFWKGERSDGKRMAINGFKVEKIKKINRFDFPPSIRPKALKVYNIECAPYNSYLIDYMWVHNCDSHFSYEGTYTTLTPAQIARQALDFNTKNVTITGGEPLLQKGLFSLISILRSHDRRISIETNGSKFIPWESGVSWIADYKLPSSGMNHMMNLDHYKNLGKSDFIKFVVKDKADFDKAVSVIATLLNENGWKHSCSSPKFAFSPVFTKNVAKHPLKDWMIDSPLLRDIGAVYSLQIHKILRVA